MPTPGTEVPLCSVEELEEGGMKHIEHMGYDLLLVRLGGKFYALDDACTVSWAMLSEGGLDAAKNAVICPQCKSVFDLQSGKPLSGPAKFPLNVYETHVVGDEVIVNFTY
ncbi:MAG: Rieske 2Fe-2S domain-containing protein [Methanobacteriota archaeon]|nr:MAG: Rieske 2Fe-2S domain-containing protein [Euryarchaeota archaeon]